MASPTSIDSPSTGYEILDIRTPEKGTIKLQKSQVNKSTILALSDFVGRPPSPPASTDPSLDAFNNADLGNTIVDSLNQPVHCKSIPTFVLYDTRGLQLFDQITHLDEYYLTNAEMDILQEHADQLADRMKEGSILIELGSGSLRKTLLTLQAIERKRIHVTYYALDLDQHELERSLASLGEFTYVDLVGLLGTYDQGIPWLSQRFTSNTDTHKVVLWLGSSVGNQKRKESAMFLRRLQRTCLQPGDLCVIGFDKRNESTKIDAAYDDSLGVTREFIMNGLDHVNTIVGQPLLDRSLFEYDSRYQVKEGRHLSHYRAKQDLVLTYQKQNETIRIPVQKDELIHVEHSYKYSLGELTSILNAAELDTLETWTDSQDTYRLVVAECRPFLFDRDKRSTKATLFPTTEELLCHHCGGGAGDDVQMDDKSESATSSLVNITGSRHWPESVPTLHEWQQLWRAWDVVTKTVMDPETMLFERPIALRHPFIFYLGHIPAFLDIQMCRNHVGSAEDANVPADFAHIFERGMDPDMENPTKCHAHSIVPEADKDWPSLESILRYQENVRNKVQRLLLQWEADGCEASEWMTLPGRRRQCRVLWMCFEHEAMHIETLLYMLMQSPNICPPKDVCVPAWKMALDNRRVDTQVYAHQVKQHDRCLEPSPTVPVLAGTVRLGHDDDEEQDARGSQVEFGWDNERPSREVRVGGFEIQTRPVTNGEYLAYLQATNKLDALPKSWGRLDNKTVGVHTVYGLCPLSYAMHWPVQVSYNEAEQYAQHHRMRLPTEPELQRFRKTCSAENKIPNIGFKTWHPTEVDNERISVFGDVWEWTETIFDTYPGFKPSALYPGYSQDFFDGKHRVILGGSWATHPRIAERSTTRNWYQSGYPYVFCGFRCCTSLG
ncbi:hypothetical protein DFQ30_007286 [Apophysomyces sp. BC1015]|nr:hypothetical protein DFQ30_007286 [Apophysomyces sp. BC1015]KAG0182075.1 hypothetical protein DFQ29_005916 [Apophysomyces sp. BC1021]